MSLVRSIRAFITPVLISTLISSERIIMCLQHSEQPATCFSYLLFVATFEPMDSPEAFSKESAKERYLHFSATGRQRFRAAELALVEVCDLGFKFGFVAVLHRAVRPVSSSRALQLFWCRV